MLIYKILGLLGVAAAVFSVSLYFNNKFLDWLRFQSIGTRDYISEKLSVMFIDIPPQRILLAQFVLSFGLGGLVFLATLPNLLPGIPLAIIVTVVGWKAPKPLVNWLYRARIRKFTLQMVDALGIMSGGMKSGLSVVQALGLVVQEMPNPIRQEFELILNQNRLGVPLEEAFTNLSKRVVSDDVEMFVTSVNILKETGGNLAETFDTIVSTIRERIKVEGKIEAMTAQGLSQGMILMCVPPVMAFVLYQSDPDFMRPLFVTPVGWVILTGVFLLELAAFVMITRIIKIDV